MAAAIHQPPAIVDIVLESLRFLQKERAFVIYTYVIIENHIHIVASCGDLGKTVKEFKSFTATQITKYLDENGISKSPQNTSKGKVGL